MPNKSTDLLKNQKYLPTSVRSELEMNIHIVVSQLLVGGKSFSAEVTPKAHLTVRLVHRLHMVSHS